MTDLTPQEQSWLNAGYEGAKSAFEARIKAAEQRVAELERVKALEPYETEKELADYIVKLEARLQQATEALREARPIIEAMVEAPVAKWSVYWIPKAQAILPRLAALAGEDDG